MTPQEHADKCLRRLERVEHAVETANKAVLSLHNALADFMAEHGAAMGIGGDTMDAARTSKDPPPNPDGG